MPGAVIDLSDKVVVITGAAGGQGSAFARLCGELGASLVLADLDAAAVQVVADGVDCSTLSVSLDVRDPTSRDAALAASVDAFGGVDVLVNNAGLYRLSGLVDVPVGDLEAAFAVNVIGPILGMQRVAPLMAGKGGSIVNIASTAALGGYAGAIAYASSKWALRGASRSAAKELGPQGIRVNCVCPGAIDTPMISEATRAGGGAVAAQPLARVGQPSEVAAMVAFLAVPRAATARARTSSWTAGSRPDDGGRSSTREYTWQVRTPIRRIGRRACGRMPCAARGRAVRQ